MSDDLLRRAAELQGRGEPYALATVVAVERPVSARAGDRAIVTTGGELEGWVGGSCSEPIVLREALAALADGNSRLVRIRPPGSPAPEQGPGVVTEVTTCASEGGLDVFVQPQFPQPRLLIAGSSPVARTLAQLARPLGYRIAAVLDSPGERLPGAELTLRLDEMEQTEVGPQDAIVVATMNRYDEMALASALATAAGYIGLVASQARGRHVLEMLRAQGIDAERLDRVRSPAGLDLGPCTQEEIALAVLAEIVSEAHRRSADQTSEPMCAEPEGFREAVDPVCGMKVAVTPAATVGEYDGATFYFCGPGCRDAFLEDPQPYLTRGALWGTRSS